MKTIQFKTNIKCGGCVEQVAPSLDNEKSIENWQVDTDSPEKVLTIAGHDPDPQRVKNLVEKAGFKAEVMRVVGTGGGDL